MTFREKMLWVSMIAVAAIVGSYLFDVGHLLLQGRVDATQAYGGFVRSGIMLVVVEVIAAIVLASIAPDDADVPADVRDRDIAARAALPSYNLLCVLVVIVILGTPVLIAAAPRVLAGDPATVNAVVIGNALLLALVMAHIVNCAAQIRRYRQGG